MYGWLIIVLMVELVAESVGNSANDAIAHSSNDSMIITGLQDTGTPQGEHLSAIYKQSFAYASIKDRLPLILQRLISSMTEDQQKLAQKFGAGSLEELRQFINDVSELRNDMITNKNLTLLSLAHSEFDGDVEIWNDGLRVLKESKGGILTFFDSPFLLSECYMHRRMNQLLARTNTLKTFDPFEKQKREGFIRTLDSATILANYTLGLLERTENLSKSEQKKELIKLLKLNLWGNKYDLSLTGGAGTDPEGDPVELLDSFDENLIVNDTKLVWDVLNKFNATDHIAIVDIILDNAGFELFSDLCLASFLLSQGFARKVRFYVKRMPWLVSDVNQHDIVWIIDYMQNSSDSNLKAFGNICAEHLKNNDWTIEIESFWTEPYDFGQMKKKTPALYRKLSEATLIVIKGGLNYRKLIGDINWEYTTTLETVLTQLDFRPTNLVSLATLKSDVCIDLRPGKAEELSTKDRDWMINGKYGVIMALTGR